jgi:hypothetical protein
VRSGQPIALEEMEEACSLPGSLLQVSNEPTGDAGVFGAEVGEAEFCWSSPSTAAHVGASFCVRRAAIRCLHNMPSLGSRVGDTRSQSSQEQSK